MKGNIPQWRIKELECNVNEQESKGFYSVIGYADKIRQIKFHNKEENRAVIFLTNNFNLAPGKIASLISLNRKY